MGQGLLTRLVILRLHLYVTPTNPTCWDHGGLGASGCTARRIRIGSTFTGVDPALDISKVDVVFDLLDLSFIPRNCYSLIL